MSSLLYLILSALIVVADKLFKMWISSNLQLGEVVRFIPGICHLTYIRNSGAAFGMLSGVPWLLLALSVIGVLILIYLLVKMPVGKFGKICIAAIIGGGIGNGIDRALEGSVVDMFEFEFIRFYVFNIADIFVTVGVIALVIYYIIYLAGHKAPDKLPSVPEAPKEEKGTEHQYTENEILREYYMENLLSEDEQDEGNGK